MRTMNLNSIKTSQHSPFGRLNKAVNDMIDVKLAVYTRVSINTKSFVAKGSIVDLTPTSTAVEIKATAGNDTMNDMKVCYG